jgi:hypothetical protein
MTIIKTIAITLAVVFAVEVAIVGAYLSQAPRTYKCEKL